MTQRSLQITTIADPPVLLLQAKNWLRIDHYDDDEALTELIAAVVNESESRTGRLFRVATCVLTLSEFPDDEEPIVLPRPPFVSLTSISYVNTAGSATALTTAQADVNAVPGVIYPPITGGWPATREQIAAVTVTYQAGATPPAEMNGIWKLMLERDYDDHAPQKLARYDARIDAGLHRLTIRDSRLSGISL